MTKTKVGNACFWQDGAVDLWTAELNLFCKKYSLIDFKGKQTELLNYRPINYIYLLIFLIKMIGVD